MGIPNYLMALANHEGAATITASGLSIPVKIMDINHEYDPRRCIDACEFKCLVVNQDQIKRVDGVAAMTMADYIKRNLNSLYGTPRPGRKVNPFEIRKVIFNAPATIVYWADGEKTVVKCQEGDVYSKETGLALCIAKKALGNKGNFNDVFHEWIPEEKEAEEVVKIHIPDVNTAVSDAVTEALTRMTEAANAAARALQGKADE